MRDAKRLGERRLHNILGAEDGLRHSFLNQQSTREPGHLGLMVSVHGVIGHCGSH
ncbi:hypothetical protein [Streptomyces guryensis]|uniref:Uncharacterized protein n=1 Tax=Streptomyces guryensis TaxID=2886947 RepID=A0A9Q3VWP0_9ACTN|nr:hypothetical protein [Streptomyces guryensis]MCD9879939.1 hypothetical protein [Streptomyces guryensis]